MRRPSFLRKAKTQAEPAKPWDPARPRTRVYSGLAALPVQLRFCLSVVYRRLFHHDRYPLLYLGSSKSGFLTTIRLLQRIELTKVVRVGRRYHFSLAEPRWPSEAYDRLMANGGLNLGAAGTPAKPQIDLAVLAITRACEYRCLHCYERQTLGERKGVPVSRWKGVIEELQGIGVSVVALSGGEPLGDFQSTLELLAGADKTRSDFHLYTSGHGATPGKVAALVEAGLVAAGVGLDDFEPARHDALRGRKGAFQDAVRALRLFAEAGILTYVNACLSKALVRSGGLWRFYDLLSELGVGGVQLLEPKPCGGYANRQVETLFGPGDMEATLRFFKASQRSKRHRRHPAVYYPAHIEAPGNLGCMMGGLSHLHIDGLGNVEPCVFVPVSFGNVNETSFAEIYRRMRAAIPRPLHARCPSLQLAERVGFGADKWQRLPLPFASVEGEWRRMFQEGVRDVEARPSFS